jgi:hypothetical protein
MKKDDRIKRIIQIKKRLIILTRLIIIIPILIRRKIKLLEIRNFIFESISFDIIKSEKKVTTVIMDAYTIYVEIRNTTNKSIMINRKRRLKTIEKYGIEKCYSVTDKSKPLAIERVSWARKVLIVDILTLTAANLVTISSNFVTIIIEMDILKKIIIDFEITVYGDITIR